MKKKYFLTLSLLVMLFSLFVYRSVNKDIPINTDTYVLIKNEYMYLYINGEPSSYYLIPKKEKIFCENVTVDGKGIFCYWYFDSHYDPLMGWIKKDSLIKSNGENK